MKSSLKGFSIVVSSLLVISGVAWAQGTAQLNGKVTDESGAVLPGVTVTATQTDTGATRTAVTDEAGAWVMQSVPIGPYKLEIALQGFSTYVQTGIVLQVNATPVINAVLRVGNVAETLTVVAAAPLVDVRTAGLRDVVEQRRIVELPLNGRQVTDLIVLAGAAVNTGRVSTLSSSNAVGYLGRGRAAQRRGLLARRGDAQQHARQHQPAVSLPRCAAGVQCRHRRPVRGERHALGGVGERGDQVGHQQLPRERVRIRPRQPVQRHRGVCPRGTGWQEGWATG